jgi:AmmeMemoRadiSam system protein B
MDGDAIETPVGQTALDKDAAAVLIAHSPRIRMNYAPHAGEHSAENEIPFVQVALPSAKLVVGLFGEHEPETLDAMVGALEDLAKKKAILAVASTDMLHDPDYDRVTRTDKATLEKIKTLDDKGLLGSWDYSEQVCCGIGPVVAVMRFAKAQGCRSGTILHYRNSGDDYPESRGSWVVGYGAVVFSVEKDK